MKWLIKTVGVALSTALFGFIGIFVGAYVGGNYPELVVFGKGGYEHLGSLGFAAGAVVGAIIGLLMKPSKKWK